ncbi:diaminobutyrate acetyltransferase [Mycolicibacter heraklionensis]|uniref:diaminobutyrate acetyltransferase n=1 Tax=Mycolicibacter heraklionensis TaxID=512402 RepID=UPI001E3BA7EA|nr:diaminobutyrate acetyltransferase [Mycolicibacter heraklionensis]
MTDMAHVRLRTPTVADGPALWQIAVDSATLDVNSPYAYLLWCRDFASTSVVAEVGGQPGGSARLDAGEAKLGPPHELGGSARLDAGEAKLGPPHELGGFVTGYRRPERPETLMVWQVAVNAAHRGAGLAGRMLDHLATAQVTQGVTHLETSITPDNDASRRLFSAFARRWDAPLECSELFGAGLFPESHLAEELFRIGPLRVHPRRQ